MSNVLDNVTLRGATVISGSVRLPAGSIGNNAIAAGADIDASKLVHRHALNYQQADGSSVATATAPIHIARGTTGTIVAIEAAILTAAVGDATVSVDLQLGDGDTAFATVLDAAIAIDSDTAARSPVAGVLDTTAFADGDILQLVVTATAGTGTLPQGLIVTVTIDETPS